jgi:hypothetical protein
MLDKALSLIKSPFFMSIISGVATDPLPSESWVKLHDNIYFRFILIFISVYSAFNNLNLSLLITSSIMVFFYMISTKEERKKVVTNNHNKKDFQTFLSFTLLIFFLYQLKNDFK